jgi:hypothetical protein
MGIERIFYYTLSNSFSINVKKLAINQNVNRCSRGGRVEYRVFVKLVGRFSINHPSYMLVRSKLTPINDRSIESLNQMISRYSPANQAVID